MGEWRLVISALRQDISILKEKNVSSINVANLERRLNELEDEFEIDDKYLMLDKINNPRREYYKNLDHYIKFFKEQNAEHRQYTQLVITAGYATFFGLWNISKDYIEQHMTMWIFLLLAISAFSFIVLEVIKVGLDGFGIHIKNNALLAARVEDNLDLISDEYALAEKYKNRFDLWTSRIWVISYPVSLVTGVSAIFLLAFSIGRSLIN